MNQLKTNPILSLEPRQVARSVAGVHADNPRRDGSK